MGLKWVKIDWNSPVQRGSAKFKSVYGPPCTTEVRHIINFCKTATLGSLNQSVAAATDQCILTVEIPAVRIQCHSKEDASVHFFAVWTKREMYIQINAQSANSGMWFPIGELCPSQEWLLIIQGKFTKVLGQLSKWKQSSPATCSKVSNDTSRQEAPHSHTVAGSKGPSVHSTVVRQGSCRSWGSPFKLASAESSFTGAHSPHLDRPSVVFFSMQHNTGSLVLLFPNQNKYVNWKFSLSNCIIFSGSPLVQQSS